MPKNIQNESKTRDSDRQQVQKLLKRIDLERSDFISGFSVPDFCFPAFFRRANSDRLLEEGKDDGKAFRRMLFRGFTDSSALRFAGFGPEHHFRTGSG